MPDVIFNGPEGRLEGKYRPVRDPSAPVALILHPHPQYGGSMNNYIVHNMFQIFVKKGFSTLRFNFRGVGRSEGKFDGGTGELSDAAAALDWLLSINPDASTCWIGGFSFGAWISMQLLMRRPEISAFVAVSPPANLYDFTFLAPCPSSGLVVQGGADEVVEPKSVKKLAEKLEHQRAITVDYTEVEGANHYFEGKIDGLIEEIERYLEMRLKPALV